MKVKLPFEPSIPGQVAALAALNDNEYLNKSSSLEEEKSIKDNIRKLSLEVEQHLENLSKF